MGGCLVANRASSSGGIWPQPKRPIVRVTASGERNYNSMTVHLLTFATNDMSKAFDLCVKSAWQNGVPRHNYYDWTFDRLCDMPLMELRPSEYWANRGVGYWLWKPYLIEWAMRRLENGNILIYSDAGVEFINNVSHIIDRMDQDIFLFGNNWFHVHWCKQDVMSVIWPHPSGGAHWERFGKQAQASVIFFRVSDYTRSFVAEWLKWSLFEGGRLIDDSPSRLPNHPQFRENRHDQSILTTMAYREGLTLHWWPAVYNRFTPSGPIFTYEKGEYQDSYPPLFHHHRLRDGQWPSTLT